MAILKQNNSQSVITSSFLSMILLGAVIFSGILINTSSRLSNASGRYTGNFGPFQLFQVYKIRTTTDIYSAGINFELGILLYISMFAVLGLVISVYRIKRT